MARRIKVAMKELEPLVNEAVSTLKIVKGEPRGRKPELPAAKAAGVVKEKVILKIPKISNAK